MKYITSRTNPVVKQVTSLHARKGRTEHQMFIAEGLRTCETLIKTCTLVTCYVTDAMVKTVTSFIAAHHIIGVTDEVMEKMSTAEAPSGILCVFELPTPKPLANLKSSVILHGIADPGNMGTLIRTVAALGLQQVICVDAADSWNPKVVHASVGTIGNVAIYHTDWATIEKCKKKSSLCALVVKGGKAPIELDFKQTVLVIGNEARGLPAEIIAACDEQCTLPMPGKTESLNAAVAGSVALYSAYLCKEL
jgi:TrmH family RNA methyltransferase